VENIMKRNLMFITALLVSLAILPTLALASECTCPPVCIDKSPYCLKTNGGPYDNFSNNPPYYMGQKYYWWIEINVTANTDLTDYSVVVYDRLGAEFMIEGICLESPKQPDLPGYPGNLPPGTIFEDFDYTFDYGMDTLEYTIPPGQAVSVDGESGTVDKDGITFGSEPYAFDIYWTGESCKVHFMWTIGPMDNESKVIYLVVSTDRNPGGHQEFTSPCTTYLNSGATVKVLRPHPRLDKWIPIYSASTDPIPIIVEES
jgi:hypothetical protein